MISHFEGPLVLKALSSSQKVTFACESSKIHIPSTSVVTSKKEISIVCRYKRVLFSRSVFPVVYIKTTVDQRSGKWQSKNTTIFLGTIIYQLHVSAVIGHLQVGIRQRKNIYYKYRCGGRDLVYKYMGLVV